MWSPLSTLLTLAVAGALLIAQDAPPDPGDWPAYGRDPGGNRYSPLAQIDRANVQRLSLAWTYRTGERGQGASDGADLAFEATPILFEGALYLSTGFGKVAALDPGTGAERWTYDPGVASAMRSSRIRGESSR